MGAYEVVLVVSLANYGGVTRQESFQVYVDDCIITGLNVQVNSQNLAFTYDVLP